MPARQPRRGRLWLNDGSCVRLRPQGKKHVWAYDFVQTRTRYGRGLRLLTIIDEYTRECLAIRAGRSLRSPDVIETLSDLMTARGVPAHLRPDNGPGFAAGAVQEWLGGVGAKTRCIGPGSPWGNGYVESFNGKLRDELLEREVLYFAGGAGADRAVPADLQPGHAPPFPRPQAANARGPNACWPPSCACRTNIGRGTNPVQVTRLAPGS